MRRLWAHILIAAAALIAVFALTPTLIKGITSNGDHETRRQFTFQLTEKIDEETNNPVKELSKNSASEMAKIMEQRLINYGVTSYNIRTSGDNELGDIVTVDFTADDNSQYQQIVTYLTFSGSFALMNNQTDVVTAAQFKNGKAYLKDVSVNEYPTVILPIKTDYTEWTELVTHAKENPDPTEESSEESEEATKNTSSVYLIYNYENGDNYKKLEEQNKLNEKTLLRFTFDSDDESTLYYNSSKNSLAQVCGYNDENGNGYADAKEVRKAFNQADYLLNLFNASALDYDVTCIKGLTEGTQVWLNPAVETVVDQDLIVWNATLGATVAGIVLVSLLLVLFYRLGALSAVTTTLVSVFSGFLFMVLAGMEYNTLALVALVGVALVSLVSSIIYLNKLKEDAYRGHTLKKANTEASKKSLLPIIDVNVVGVVIGLMCYLLGGTALHSFGSILVFGSLISLVVSTLGMKGLMWLATNTTGLTGKYEVFGINPENVPNHMAEEKQRYFGQYADKDYTVKKKPVGLVACGAFVLSIVGIILSATLAGGIVKPIASKALGNELYVENKIVLLDDTTKSELNDSTLNEHILSVIEIEQKDGTYLTLDNYVANTSYDTFEVKDSVTEDDVTTNYSTTYYVVSLKPSLSLTSKAKLDGEAATEARELTTVLSEFYDKTSLFSSSEANSISIKTTKTVVQQQQTDFGKVTLATSIAILILTVYFMIRYRLSRGLATLIFPVVSGTITLGLLALLSVIGITMNSGAVIALPLVVLFNYFFMVIYMNKEREMVLDDKTRDTTFEHRQELSIRALGIAFTPVLAVSAVGIYLLINFFGFGTLYGSYGYLVAILGTLVALAIFTVLFVPVSNFFYKLFSKITIERKPRERKNKKANVKKSAEPEEAIFIGIND